MKNYDIVDGRIISDRRLTPADFVTIAAELSTTPSFVRKHEDTAVRIITAEEAGLEIITFNATGQEACTIGVKGNAIATRLEGGVPVRNAAGQLDQWQVEGKKVEALFDSTGEQVIDTDGTLLGERCRSANCGWFIPVKGVNIITSFGQQITQDGVLMFTSTGSVRGCDTAGFTAYQPDDEPSFPLPTTAAAA